MMVGSWSCTVLSEVHINGQCVSKPIEKDKGKVTVPELEDEKDPKRTHMVLSKGREMVGPGYSRLSGDAASVADRGEESGNPNWVGRVHRKYDTDRRTDRVTRDSRGNRGRYSGRWANRLTRDSRGIQDYHFGRWTDWVTRDNRGNQDGGSGQQTDRVTRVSRCNEDSNPKSRNSSRVTENLANTEVELWKIRLLHKAGVHRIWLTQRARLRRIRLTRRAEL
jgi:hypothetical protein